ncbi:hypothetical protein ZIOFF_023132 [Zingiber officinale]|uniref:Reverse transcriptase Ty1/copia-type domain-containing protein n=1 Tax=Zingiber officinale TaxID=94328 RepID=A0A8J5LHT7_ZINOF|nr:hypothetical protein ZIOFF_023132 [Zingiber officinale]
MRRRNGHPREAARARVPLTAEDPYAQRKALGEGRQWLDGLGQSAEEKGGSVATRHRRCVDAIKMTTAVARQRGRNRRGEEKESRHPRPEGSAEEHWRRRSLPAVSSRWPAIAAVASSCAQGETERNKQKFSASFPSSIVQLLLGRVPVIAIGFLSVRHDHQCLVEFTVRPLYPGKQGIENITAHVDKPGMGACNPDTNKGIVVCKADDVGGDQVLATCQGNSDCRAGCPTLCNAICISGTCSCILTISAANEIPAYTSLSHRRYAYLSVPSEVNFSLSSQFLFSRRLGHSATSPFSRFRFSRRLGHSATSSFSFLLFGRRHFFPERSPPARHSLHSFLSGDSPADSIPEAGNPPARHFLHPFLSGDSPTDGVPEAENFTEEAGCSFFFSGEFPATSVGACFSGRSYINVSVPLLISLCGAGGCPTSNLPVRCRRLSLNVVQPFFTMAGTGGSGLQIVSEKLSETNCASWAVAIELYVEGHDKLDILHGSKVKPDENDPSFRTWRRDNIQLMTLILNSVSSGIKQVILHNKTTYDMWKTLEQMYGRRHDMLCTYQLNSQIFKLEQGIRGLGLSVTGPSFYSPWVIDSGATDHMTNAPNSFISYSLSSGQEKVIIVDGTKAIVAGKGSIKLTDHFFLSSALHDLETKQTIGAGREVGGLYYYQLETTSPLKSAAKYIITYKRRRHKQGPTIDWLVESDALAPDPMKQLSSSVEPTAPLNMNELNLPVAVRKGVRSCTQHPISNHISYSRLSPSYHVFVSQLSNHAIPSSYYEVKEDRTTILLVYVDDMIVTGDDEVEIQALKSKLTSEFEIKDLGSLRYFLGIEVARSKKGIYVCQRKYVLDLLKETGKLGSRPASIPIEVNHDLTSPSGEDLTNLEKGTYQRLVGKLLYLSMTRLDITYAVSVVSQYMHAPKTIHMKVVDGILRYLKSCPGKGLLFKGGGDLKNKPLLGSEIVVVQNCNSKVIAHLMAATPKECLDSSISKLQTMYPST